MIFVKMASQLPMWWVYFWFRMSALFAFYLMRYRREVVHENIKNAFPEKSEKERFKIEKAFYFQFTEVLAEITKSYSFRRKDWEEQCKLINPQLLREHLDKGEPVFLLSGHTANWEWPAHAISSLIGYPMEFLYKPMKYQVFEDIMYKLRTRHGGVPISKDSALREILKRKNKARIIGIIGDQIPAFGAEKKWVQFLNQYSAFYVGAERLATAVKYPVYFSDTQRISKGRYEVTFRPIDKPPYSSDSQIILKYANLLEDSIKRNPPDYLWSHKRWKYTREDVERKLNS